MSDPTDITRLQEQGTTQALSGYTLIDVSPADVTNNQSKALLLTLAKHTYTSFTEAATIVFQVPRSSIVEIQIDADVLDLQTRTTSACATELSTSLLSTQEGHASADSEVHALLARAHPNQHSFVGVLGKEGLVHIVDLSAVSVLEKLAGSASEAG